MNSVSPTAVQYTGGAMHSELAEGRRPPAPAQQGGFGLRPPQSPGPGREASEEPEEIDKLKAKLMSAWNNVKYGWTVKSKTFFNKSSPVTVLGHSYLLNSEEQVERFRLAFVSRLWLTYRREFPQLEGSSWTTDCGWGCMLRSGQMLLAQGLLVHLMPREWTWPDAQQLTDVDFEVLRVRSPVRVGGVPIPSFGSPRGSGTPEKTPPSHLTPNSSQKKRLESSRDRQAEAVHQKLLAWFGDQPPTPFGVHQLVAVGRSSGKKAGDWYGPSVVAHILRKAVAKSAVVHNMAVYVAQDCTVYKEDVARLCEASLGHPPPEGDDRAWKSLVVLVPVRLGGETLNPSYIDCVKNILKLECCIGIIGGKPKHSLYFVGFQDEQLLYLDPHYCQPVVDVTQVNFPLESFHCSSPKKMPFTRMDPSCTIGFYARNKKDFESLCSSVSLALSSSAEKYPIFTFVEGQSHDYGLEAHSSDRTGPAPHILPPGKPARVNNRRLSDEFVFL
ncbi:cysteine protease atg4da [Syngnathoides biaculeatus]|uniref:cysteine protease atg4da n=1 Tax=Syngnathoides biaculeatus TaxID=300417 RepID=UPI002ADE7C9A|nr:cysteine protease atg4da [Syngnathoides biaculeatus]XP_061686634.1 cysteine protease atg4da [Syngnathoides biaculeatus]